METGKPWTVDDDGNVTVTVAQRAENGANTPEYAAGCCNHAIKKTTTAKAGQPTVH